GTAVQSVDSDRHRLSDGCDRDSGHPDVEPGRPRRACVEVHNHSMTSDERAQLVEDIKKSDTLRRGIVERAELSKDFDILAAWEEVEKLDESITKRIGAARMHQ